MTDRILMDRRVEFEVLPNSAFEFRWYDQFLRVWKPVLMNPDDPSGLEKTIAGAYGTRTIVEIRVVTFVR